jgi:hypothetical protein
MATCARLPKDSGRSGANLWHKSAHGYERRSNVAVRPTHFEFYSNDPEASVDFLAKAFGWGVERYGDADYWLIDTGEGHGINGAVVRSGDDGPKTLNTCDVEDIDAAVQAVEMSGGTLVSDIVEIEGVGRYAQVQGPGGEEFGLMEPVRLS